MHTPYSIQLVYPVLEEIGVQVLVKAMWVWDPRLSPVDLMTEERERERERGGGGQWMRCNPVVHIIMQAHLYCDVVWGTTHRREAVYLVSEGESHSNLQLGLPFTGQIDINNLEKIVTPTSHPHQHTTSSLSYPVSIPPHVQSPVSPEEVLLTILTVLHFTNNTYMYMRIMRANSVYTHI